MPIGETQYWFPTIIGTGIVLAGLILVSFRRLDVRLDLERAERRAEHAELRANVRRLDTGTGELRERMAKLEGLCEAITGRRAA